MPTLSQINADEVIEDQLDRIKIETFAHAFQQAAEVIHRRNGKWWIDIHTGQRITRNTGEILMLIVSEIAEAMEGHRKGLQDDKLPHFAMFDVEIADALTRIMDLAGGTQKIHSIARAFVEKNEYNRTRADHQIENRIKPGGKKY